jgi:hypothetical protein
MIGIKTNEAVVVYYSFYYFFSSPLTNLVIKYNTSTTTTFLAHFLGRQRIRVNQPNTNLDSLV